MFIYVLFTFVSRVVIDVCNVIFIYTRVKLTLFLFVKWMEKRVLSFVSGNCVRAFTLTSKRKIVSLKFSRTSSVLRVVPTVFVFRCVQL